MTAETNDAKTGYRTVQFSVRNCNFLQFLISDVSDSESFL